MFEVSRFVILVDELPPSKSVDAISIQWRRMMRRRKKEMDMRAGKGEKEVKGARSREKMKGKAYEEQLAKLHVELVKLQEWVKREGAKICLVFEGRDGAGKGGVIKAITERVSPRVLRDIALPSPTEREKTQMYVQRYMPHFPAAGEVVIFDRSWYNRAGVERVMEFTSAKEVERFLSLCPEIE